MILRFHSEETNKRCMYGGHWRENETAVTLRQYSLPTRTFVHTYLRGFRVVSSVL